MYMAPDRIMDTFRPLCFVTQAAGKLATRPAVVRTPLGQDNG